MKRIVFLLCIGLLVSFGPEQQIKWIALGDSITYLNDHPDETGNRVVKGYLTRVTEKIPRLQYVNKGYNGWTACRIAEKNMVKYKRLKDEAGEYHHYRYPDFVDVGFNPDADEYPYPPRAVNMTYDGLHPSDEGNEMIARMLVKMLQKIKLY